MVEVRGEARRRVGSVNREENGGRSGEYGLGSKRSIRSREEVEEDLSSRGGGGRDVRGSKGYEGE